MNPIVIEATKYSPRVELKPDGKLIFQGRCLIEETPLFYRPILEWVKNISCEEVVVEVRMEYMNTSSSKHLFTILKSIAVNPMVKHIQVKWFYEEDDEDMLEIGKDYASLVHIPFDFYSCRSTAA